MNEIECVKVEQIPQKTYIGDPLLLKCTFIYKEESNQEETVSNKGNKQKKDSSKNENKQNALIHEELSTENFLETIDPQILEIKKIEVREIGINLYELNINAVPWGKGLIELPDFMFYSKNLKIKLNAINVSSILENKNYTELRKVQPPLLIPGTTYTLYSIIIIFIIITIIFVNAIFKRKKIKEWLKNHKRKKELQKNRKLALKKLSALKSANFPLKECSKEIQTIFRSYLKVRFEKNFDSLTRMQIKSELDFFLTDSMTDSMTGFKEDSKLKDNQSIKVLKNNINDLFSKTDYYKYSNINFSTYGKTEKKDNELSLVSQKLAEEAIQIILQIEDFFTEQDAAKNAEVQNV